MGEEGRFLALMLLSLTSESSSLSRVTSRGRAPASSTLHLPFVITAMLEGGGGGEREEEDSN